MPAQNDNQILLNILERFNGLQSLKTLQAQLNLDREEAPISRRDWKETTKTLLAADPVITATIGGNTRVLFGDEQSFKIIYCRLASPELLLTQERAIVTELLDQYPYALFVFSDQPQKRFHFLNVKDEPEGQKRRLFRRITVGNGERLRTAAEQLSKLDGEVLKHLPLSGIQARFDEAFDVGPVTKKFFAEYKRVFDLVKAGIQGFAADQAGEEARNLFTQRLFNRLMFLAFIQKKGWLRYGGNADYLCTLWTAHQRDTFANKGSFYEGRLKPLFFLGLNTGPSEVNLVGINRGGGLKDLIGDVPYLNGGLFEKDADDDNPKIRITDAGLDAVINDLFERFNFTITESTPLDVEVAVDPEMLGKIFEELVTGRHESGSYYTPKPIVSFMCREALKGYLETQVANESKEAIARFIDRHEPDDIRDAEGVLNALRRVTVCDPACGSGAYLLGMLHELLDLRESLFKTKRLDHEKVYDRKLEIIQTNIYGVDIAEFAVNIARLRLWLSLAVDYGGAKPEPLPNLDYKIEVGDSVCSPSPGALQMGLQQPLVEALLQAKSSYLRSHDSEKRQLRERVVHLREDIRVFANRGAAEFDWVIDFPEVFTKGGFDLVIANPPYISGKNLLSGMGRAYKNHLERQYSSADGHYDIYVVFWELALRLAKAGAQTVLITPDKFMVAKYGTAIRRLLGQFQIRAFADISTLGVFESAAVYPVIAAVQTSKEEGETAIFDGITSVDTLLVHAPRLVPQNTIFASDGTSWALKPGAAVAGAKPLCEIALVHGGTTGFAAQALLNAITEGPSSDDSIPFIVTRNIDPYSIEFGNVRYMNQQFADPFLSPNFDFVTQGKWSMFKGPKIVVAGMTRRLEAAFCQTPVAVGVAVYSITGWQVDPFYLLGWLNSDVVSAWYTNEFQAKHLAGGYLSINKGQLERIPVPIASSEVQRRIAELVQLQMNDPDGERSAELLASIEEIAVELFEEAL